MASDPSYVLQKVIGERLIASDDVLDFVPEDSILDVSGRPERLPAIIIGEGQTVFGSFEASTVYADLHVWVQEPGLEQVKQIASAIVDAISVDGETGNVLRLDGFICHDVSVERTRYLRDPHGPMSHGIVSVAARMKAT